MPRFDPLSYALRAALKAFNALRHPTTRGTLSLKGLTGEVEIIRDRWGMPHIYAETMENVLFGQGFVHAQERLFQMDFTRRVVSGRLSEVLGKAGLEADRVFRTLGLRQVVEESVSKLDEVEQSLMAAFCEGVNAGIQREPRPVEFTLLGYQPEPWIPADSFSWNMLLYWILGNYWDTKLLRGQIKTLLGEEQFAALELGDEFAWPLILDSRQPGPYRPGQALTGPSLGEGVGSNNWAISGDRTASGKPLLADDMHLTLGVPSIFIQNHLSWAGQGVAGVSLPGAPLVIQGHNGKVAWAYTAGCSDIQDLYEEHLREREGVTEYEFRGEWLPAKTRQERIRVKGQPDVVETVVETCHGPIINHALLSQISPDSPPYALKWTAFERVPIFTMVRKMNAAGDCYAFHEAMRYFPAPTHNMVYADTQGNIGYTHAGKVPIRACGDASAPLPGWTGECEWQGMIPFEEMPHMINPPRGYIATANNRVAGPDYPYFMGKDFFFRDRAQRICEMIEERPTATLAGLQAMQFDVVSPTARLMASAARQLRTEDDSLRPALDLMANFDGRIEPNSPAAALYEVWVRQSIAVTLEGRFGPLSERIRGKGSSGMWDFHAMEWLSYHLDQPDSAWWQSSARPGRDATLLEGLRRAVAIMHEKFGPDMADWSWGALHEHTFGHTLGSQKLLAPLFNLGPYPLRGDSNTVCAGGGAMADCIPGQMTGAPFRFTIDMADPDHAQVSFVPGQSGRPGTRHYGDGIEEWLAGKYHTLLFKRDEIEQAAEATLKLRPEA